MTGYEFHPEARVDLAEIWEFVRSDNLDAADRVIWGDFVRHSRIGSVSRSRPQTHRPHLASFALHPGA
jgi:plasmid stabilization system protein ParE